jgi:hypothetical protein
MPRYIDADAFIVDSIKNKRFVIHSEDFENDSIIVETVYGDLLDAINSMPTIDAVEVVRCKDCVYRDQEFRCIAIYYGFNPHDDWFCANGRKDGRWKNEADFE